MKLKTIYRQIVTEGKLEVGLFDFDDDRWITDQAEANRYYGKLPINGPTISNVLYHGTNNSDRILLKGLWGGSFVATTWEKASMYGSVILKLTLPSGTKISWGEDENEFQVVDDVDPKYIEIYKDERETH